MQPEERQQRIAEYLQKVEFASLEEIAHQVDASVSPDASAQRMPLPVEKLSEPTQGRIGFPSRAITKPVALIFGDFIGTSWPLLAWRFVNIGHIFVGALGSCCCEKT